LMSAMYFVVRYLGYPIAIIQSFGGSSLLFGSDSFCAAIYIFMIWGFAFFILVTDLIMILRVYAMYHRSRIILGVLLLVYIPTTIIHLVLTGIANNPNTHLSVAAVEVFNTKSCAFAYSDATNLLMYINVSRTVISVVLCIFSVAKFWRHSLERHRTLGRWQVNRYMKLLVQGSILYFVADVLYNIVALMLGISMLRTVGAQIFGGTSSIAPYIIAPRLIISVREIHSRITGEDPDSGFGLASERFSTSGGESGTGRIIGVRLISINSVPES